MNIIFENADFLIVDKPQGISMQLETCGEKTERDGGSSSDDEVFTTPAVDQDGVLWRLKQQLGYSELYPVHRLDKMTSGLLIVGKTVAAAREFQELFSQHLVQKYYLALSDKKPKKKQGLIQGDMVRARRGSYKLAPSRNNPASTRFISHSVMPGLRLFLLKPLSGKTHQLRVALKSISAPIIGDERYHHAELARQWDRGYLHAYALSFEWKGQLHQWVLPPKEGKEFLRSEIFEILDAWQTPWNLL
ncbi:pseudouridine synthase [Thiomicrorhabdus sp.]|uniref:pseudouridine synthase n=1 Tax=Thiomicrorhabdus sp. TaxID=2039724 RepID=UPI0029C78EFF|nr:pseudouridine synthase [Thiomicrorhabdus sp.]